jgi:hypothetical protein
MSKIRIRSEQNIFKKDDIESYSIISLYANDPRSEIYGPKILIPKVCINVGKKDKIYCSIPIIQYGGNKNTNNNNQSNCDITKVEDLNKTKPCCINNINDINDTKSSVNYIGLYNNNVKYTDDDTKKRIDFRNLNYQTALAVFGLSVVYSPTLSMYSGMLIENNIKINSVWVDDLYINKINIDNIIPNLLRDIDCFYNIPIVNPNTITVNPLSNNDLNNFYFKPNILNEKLIKNLFYYGIISPKNIYKYISIITDKVFGIPINENPDFWIKDNYIPDKNIFKNAIQLPNAVFIFNSNFYKYANYFDKGKEGNREYINWLNSKINAYSKSLNENIFNIEKKNKRTLLEELLLFFNTLKKSNEFGRNNKYISPYAPTWDYTFKANTIKKNIINLKNGDNKLEKKTKKKIDYVKVCLEDCNVKNININYTNKQLEYDCGPKTNCKTLIEKLFTTWQLYNREDWPKTPSKELASFYNLLLKNNNLDMKLIINWASQVKDDLDKEYKYRKQGLKYYSKYNPFQLKEMFKVLQQYTARVTWPNGLGISYNGNNEKTMTKNKTNNDNYKPDNDQYIENNPITDLEEEFQNYKIKTNNKTNNETNYETNYETNNETNYETNNETNNETNYETNNETNNETSNLENFTNIKFDEEEIRKAFKILKDYFDKKNLLLCLIGIDETLFNDSNFSNILSSVSDNDGKVKHYSKDTNVMNNHYIELIEGEEEEKQKIDLINSLNIELIVNNKRMRHVVGSLKTKDAEFLKNIGYGVVINIGNSQEVIAYGNTDQDQYIIDQDENDSIFNLVDKEKTDKKDNDIILLPYCEAKEWTFYPYPTESAKIYFPSCCDGYLELYIITPTLESANKEPIYGGGFYYKAQDNEEILYVVHDENNGSNKSNTDLIDTLLDLKKVGTLNNNSNEMDSFTRDVIVMKGEPNMFKKFNDYISYQTSNWESPKLNKININNGYIYYKYR